MVLPGEASTAAIGSGSSSVWLGVVLGMSVAVMNYFTLLPQQTYPIPSPSTGRTRSESRHGSLPRPVHTTPLLEQRRWTTSFPPSELMLSRRMHKGGGVKFYVSEAQFLHSLHDSIPPVCARESFLKAWLVGGAHKPADFESATLINPA